MIASSSELAPTVPFTAPGLVESAATTAALNDRRRLRYRAAEDLVVAAAQLLDDTPGDREIDELLGMAMARLMARGRRCA